MAASSPSLTNLRASLEIVGSLLKLEKVYPDPPPIGSAAAVEGLRAGAAVLVVASFEEFLKSIFRDELSRLTSARVDFARLPIEIRVESAFKQLESALRGPGKRESRLPNIVQAAQRVHEGRLHPEAFASTQSNPSPETVARMFKDVGLSDIFLLIKRRFERGWRAPVAATFIRDKLEEIVQRRHEVAHSGRALNVSRQALAESVRFVRVLSTCLDQVLRSHCISTAKAAKRGP